mgnify:FL=1
MSNIERRYCIVKVDPHSGVFHSVEAIRKTLDEVSDYFSHIPDELRRWYIIWDTPDFEGN